MKFVYVCRDCGSPDMLVDVDAPENFSVQTDKWNFVEGGWERK